MQRREHGTAQQAPADAAAGSSGRRSASAESGMGGAEEVGSWQLLNDQVVDWLIPKLKDSMLLLMIANFDDAQMPFISLL